MTSRRVNLGLEATRRMTLYAEPWLSCDDCFALIDQHVEALCCGASSSAAMRAHLTGCSACADEARTLAFLVAWTDGLDPGRVLEQLPAS